MNDEQKDEFEYLDMTITKCMLQAESKCRKLRMGSVPFSPRLATLLNTINLWRLIIQRKRGRKVNMRTIIRLQKRCDVKGCPLTLTMHDCISRKTSAISAYRLFRKEASKERGKWLDERI